MSFQQKGFWMPRDVGCLTEGDTGYDNSSRMEQKRGHQWFLDTNGPELFSNKKQAIEAGTNRPVSGEAVDASLWHNISNFQSVSGQLSDRLFGSETAHSVNVVDRNVASVGGGNLHMGRDSLSDQYVHNASMGLSMSHAIEDAPGIINFGGIRKVKVNQVRDSSNVNPAFLGQPYSRGDNNTISLGTTYGKSGSNTTSLGTTYTKGDGNMISMGFTFGKEDDNFISMGHAFRKEDGSFMSMGHYTKGDNRILSMGQPLDKGDASFMAMGPPSYGKGDSSVISMASSFEKEQENFISMGSSYDKPSENFISMGPSFVKGNENIISMGSTYDKAESNITSLGSRQDKADSAVLSIGQNCFKGDVNAICFGGFNDAAEANPSGGIIGGYDALMSNLSPSTTSVVPDHSNQIPSSVDPVVNNGQKARPKSDATSKNKEPKATKKAPANTFPSNVKSLLSTGMLDGVPVKYVSWSREKNLKGTIKGTGYLCGCNKCNFSKVLNAYEFECHANCKTKHPNNHIYFENGKTIYAVVQELKNTPQDMLFDVIQNVTGSPINQKNFCVWKASYQAATRELQRIYGKDEVIIPS